MTHKARILIVDDNHKMARMTAFILKNKGYRVVSAEDGLEAIQIVKDGPFDMIFMDIKMPIMDG